MSLLATENNYDNSDTRCITTTPPSAGVSPALPVPTTILSHPGATMSMKRNMIATIVAMPDGQSSNNAAYRLNLTPCTNNNSTGMNLSMLPSPKEEMTGYEDDSALTNEIERFVEQQQGRRAATHVVHASMIGSNTGVLTNIDGNTIGSRLLAQTCSTGAASFYPQSGKHHTSPAPGTTGIVGGGSAAASPPRVKVVQASVGTSTGGFVGHHQLKIKKHEELYTTQHIPYTTTQPGQHIISLSEQQQQQQKQHHQFQFDTKFIKQEVGDPCDPPLVTTTPLVKTVVSVAAWPDRKYQQQQQQQQPHHHNNMDAPYLCDACDFRALTEGELAAHVVTTHDGDDDDSSSSMVRHNSGGGMNHHHHHLFVGGGSFRDRKLTGERFLLESTTRRFRGDSGSEMIRGDVLIATGERVIVPVPGPLMGTGAAAPTSREASGVANYESDSDSDSDYECWSQELSLQSIQPPPPVTALPVTEQQQQGNNTRDHGYKEEYNNDNKCNNKKNNNNNFMVTRGASGQEKSTRDNGESPGRAGQKQVPAGDIMQAFNLSMLEEPTRQQQSQSPEADPSRGGELKMGSQPLHPRFQMMLATATGKRRKLQTRHLNDGIYDPGFSYYRHSRSGYIDQNHTGVRLLVTFDSGPIRRGPKGQWTYRCSWCEREFTSAFGARQHRLHQHGHECFYDCIACRRRFTLRQLTELIKGPVQATRFEIFLCPFCDASRKPKDPASELNKAVFACRYCDRRYRTRDQLINHERIHTGAPPQYPCETCGLVADCKEALQEHVRYAHPDKRSLDCSYCGATYKRKSNLLSHLATLHSDKSAQRELADFRAGQQQRGNAKRRRGAGDIPTVTAQIDEADDNDSDVIKVAQQPMSNKRIKVGVGHQGTGPYRYVEGPRYYHQRPPDLKQLQVPVQVASSSSSININTGYGGEHHPSLLSPKLEDMTGGYQTSGSDMGTDLGFPTIEVSGLNGN